MKGGLREGVRGGLAGAGERPRGRLNSAIGGVSGALALVLAACLTASPACARRAAAADLVLRGGGVYTMDAARSWAEALAVRGNRIVYVGTDAGVEKWIGKDTRLIDLAGRMVLPGFQDSHVHAVGGGIALAQLDLTGVRDREDILRRIREYARANPNLAWVVGRGWEPGAFLPSGVPNRQILDSLVPDRPAFLESSDGHTGWANSKALEAAGVTALSPDPRNGRIGRDERTGEPTGILYEYASTVVEKQIPAPGLEERLAGLERAMAEFRRHGITSIIDAGIRDTDLETFAEAAKRGLMTVRATLSLRFQPDGGDEQVDQFLAWRRQLPSGIVRATAVKIPLDGIIETYTAAMLDPYLDGPRDRGPIFLEPMRLNALVSRLDREGFQVHIHAIGDRAVRSSLDAFEHAQRENGARDSRHHVAHVESVHPDDIPRFRELRAAANFSPLWARADENTIDLTEPRLGPQRSKWLYAMQSFVAEGVPVVFGSDWPVSSVQPLDGIEVAVTREIEGGSPRGPWKPEQRMALPDTLAAYTINGAWLDFSERERGSLEPGKLADLVVLSAGLFRVPPRQIHEVQVDLTVFDGRIVHERERPRTAAMPR